MTSDANQSLQGVGSPLTRVEVDRLLSNPHLLASEQLLYRRFPQLAASVRIQDFPLTVRVQTCLETLQKHYKLREMGDLSRFTVGQLFGMKNFGRKSMIDLLSSVKAVIVDGDTHATGNSAANLPLSALVTAAAEHLRAQPYSLRIRCTDPRFGPDACALLVIANSSSYEAALSPSSTVQAVAHLLAARTCDKSPPELALDAIKKVRSRAARARRLTLEKELREIAGCFLTGRNVDVALSFLGWSGNGVKTLQTVGDEFLLTRERVRQITSKFTKKLGPSRPFAPTLKRVLAFVTRRIPGSSAEIEAGLCKAGLTRSHFRVDGIISAAELLGLPVSFVSEEHKGSRTLVRHENTGLAKAVVKLARKTVSHAGLGKLADLRDLVHEENGILLEESTVRDVLQSVHSVQWLDEQQEWFSLLDSPRNHLVTLVNKVLSVAPRIHVNEMRGAIANDYRGMGFAPPKPVVLEFCRIAANCDIDGDAIVARHPPSTVEVLSEGEQLACEVLKENGTPLLHRSDFGRLCIERGMNPHTFSLYVGRLCTLARYGPGVYGLRGAATTPGDVERCIPQTVERFRDHGWAADAKPWLSLELSAAAVSTGIITVPSAFSRFIQGRYLARTQDGLTVGTLVISKTSGWGLRPLFIRRGGEPGDVLFLKFDPQRHEVAVRLGTKEDMFAETDDGSEQS